MRQLALRRPRVAVGSAVGVAALLALLVVLWPAVTNALGVGLTALALLIAVLIYWRQQIESTTSHSQLMDELEVIKEAVDVPITAPERAELAEADPYTEATGPFEAHARDIGDGVGFVPRGDVPLSVLADLVSHWDEEEAKGRWAVQNLVGAARKQARGNHPWIVAFRNSAGELRIWRVSKGGRGKRAATVNELTEVTKPAA